MALNLHYATLGWPNLVYISTLGSDDPGDWDADFPLAAWLDATGDQQARSADLTDIHAFGVLDRSRRVQIAAIHSHNLTVDATWRVIFYGDEARTEVLYTSPWVPAVPAIYTTAELNWEDPNFWTGQANPDDLAQITPLSYHVATSAVIARAWRIEVQDDDNAAGYVELRAFVSDAWQPVINRRWGASTNLQVTTGVQQTRRGRRYYDVSTPLRTASFDYSYLQEAEKIRLDRLKRELGIHGELFFALNLEGGVSAFQNTYIATLEQLDPITDPYASNWQTRINLLEKIFL